MKKNIFLFVACSVAFFISCKKDNSSTGQSQSGLTGNWKFMSLQAHTEVTAQYNDAGISFKDVSTSDYISYNNGGTLNFSNGTATSTDITYAVSTTVFDQSYEDDVLIDTFSAPFTWTIQPASSASKYQVIGTDSLFFPAGAFISSQSIPGGTEQSMASGYKFYIKGDSLTMTSNFSKDTVAMISGLAEQLNQKATFSVYLKRQ